MDPIGRTVVLWKIRRSEKNAYTDQFGVSREATVVEEEVVVTIAETKNVIGTWSNKPVPDGGRKAVSNDGRIFVTNWNVFDDASMSPYAHWVEIDNAGQVISHFWDAYNRVSGGAQHKPCITERGERAIPFGMRFDGEALRYHRIESQ